MISVNVIGVDVISRLASASVKRFEFYARVVVSHDVQITIFDLSIWKEFLDIIKHEDGQDEQY